MTAPARSLRLLLIHDVAQPMGGAEVWMLDLRGELRRRGHDVRLLTSDAYAPVAGAEPEYLARGTRTGLRTVLQSLNPWAAGAVRAAVADFRPDIVFVGMFLTQLSPLILRELAGTRALYYAMWYRPICFTGTKFLPNGEPCGVPSGVACWRNGCVPARDWLPLRLQASLLRNGMRVFNRIVANSHALARHLTEGGIATTDVVHHGVPVRQPRPALGATPLAGFAGRLVPEKGADVLVRAFARLRERVPDARLRIAGDGPSVAMVRDLAVALGVGDAVEFRGHVSRDTLDEALGACWVQAVPSRWHEPFGIVAAEAMMRGTAVVASDAGGLAEQVVANETGLLVPPGDVPALATALTTLLSSRERAEQMGASARKHAQRYFSLPRIVDDFQAIFDDMLSAPEARSRPGLAGRSFLPVA